MPDAFGQRQSPIEISDWQASHAAAPRFDYTTAAERVERVHGVPMIHYARGSAVWIDERRYGLLQMHWHTPAEHVIEAEELAAELHLVHQNDDRALLVAGIVYRLGEANPALQRVLESTPAAGGEARGIAELPAADYAPTEPGFYHYDGSLTAPPYSEPVLWYVSCAVETLSTAQAEQLQALTNGPNSRPLQDRNDRPISCVGCVQSDPA